MFLKIRLINYIEVCLLACRYYIQKVFSRESLANNFGLSSTFDQALAVYQDG